jgi:hypothetical protein
MSDVTILPDGSAFSVMTLPLPADHWLTKRGYNVPPMPLRMGAGEARSQFAGLIREAAKYAVRASTMNGRDNDFDPDAMVQNFIVGLLGYWTEDGTSDDSPDPLPPLFTPPVIRAATPD